MTTDEQAPVRCVNCQHLETSHIWDDRLKAEWCSECADVHDDCDDFVPAPEETVETTEHIHDWSRDGLVCLECGAEVMPAPEPAGEAEEPMADHPFVDEVRWEADICPDCGLHRDQHPPAPSSGTPGLTEAQTSTKKWRALFSAWEGGRWGDLGTLMLEVEAAIAAEARAPLEEQLAAVTAERDEGVRRWFAAWGRETARAEEAERQRDEAHESIRVALSGLESGLYADVEYTLRAALTQPASTAAEEPTDAG